MDKEKICIYADGFGNIKIGKLPYIVPKNKEDLLIEPIYVGVCGTDKKIVDLQYRGIVYPRILGHEWIGRVVESYSERIKKGSLVTGECSLYCKKCRQCKVDYNSCDSLEKFGISVDGAMRSFFWVSSEFVHFIPSTDYIWCFIEPMASVLHLLSQLKINKEIQYRVLILGAGQMGILSATALLENYNNLNLYMYDIDKVKETQVIHLLKNVSSISIDEKYDIVIDTVGSEESLFFGCDRIVKSGQLCTLGTTKGTMDIAYITLNCLSIYGTIGGSGYFEKAIDIINGNINIIRGIETVMLRVSDIDNLDLHHNKKIIIDMRSKDESFTL